VTSHDGFTLLDLVSYNQKHNEHNGEDGRDGENHNRSWNCGVEGETRNEEVLALRAQQQRNFLATLLLSQGVPMLLAGDEMGRTQRGNNNAYCQDNVVSWVDWRDPDLALLEFTRLLVSIRRSHPVFQRRRWFEGSSIRGANLTDIGWFKPDGHEMVESDWHVTFARAVGIYLNGQGIQSLGPRGQRLVDDDFYLVLSADAGTLEFTIPEALGPGDWNVIVDTDPAFNPAQATTYQTGEIIDVPPRTVVALLRVNDTGRSPIWPDHGTNRHKRLR
jgi:glycogen operon protein